MLRTQHDMTEPNVTKFVPCKYKPEMQPCARFVNAAASKKTTNMCARLKDGAK